MSLTSQRTWVCDYCDKEVVLACERQPEKWKVATTLKMEGWTSRSKSLDFCEECTDFLFPYNFSEKEKSDMPKIEPEKRKRFWSWFGK